MRKDHTISLAIMGTAGVLGLAACLEQTHSPDTTPRAKVENKIRMPDGTSSQVLTLPSGERIFIYERSYGGDAGGAMCCCLLPALPVVSPEAPVQAPAAGPRATPVVAP